MIKKYIKRFVNLMRYDKNILTWNNIHGPMQFNHFMERDQIKHEFIDSDPKLIALYLPQFHPFEENNEIWERNFTEWTNVSKALPQFVGHNQPRLPYECGFYDLRIVDNIRWQAELAKQYGIYGWCIMYYFFGGKVIMDTPLKLILENPDIDINFCIEWANEPWTRKWDGQENDVTIPQTNDKLDDLIRNILEIAKDPRYIKVGGAPLIVIYRKDIIDNVESVIKLWRDIAQTEYDTDIHLILCETFDNREDPRPYGFDAAMQYPPHPTCDDFAKYISKIEFSLLNPSFTGIVHSYENIVRKELYDVDVDYPLYRTSTLDWDNTARRNDQGTVFYGCTPELYHQWTSYNIQHARDNSLPFTFINAWNEWAEGAYLEPDRRSGYRYLYETREALNE